MRETAVFGIPNADRTRKELPAGYAGGRLTLTSGTPVTTVDVDATTEKPLLYTPYLSNEIAFPASTRDGGRWFKRNFSESKLLVTGLSGGSAGAGTVSDIFAEPSGGTLSMYGVAWSSLTARVTELSYIDNVPVHRLNQRAVYLGTIYAETILASTRTRDMAAYRWVWNAQNRVARFLSVVEGTATWTYTTNTLRQANANTANQLTYVCGLSVDPVFAEVFGSFSNTGAGINVRVGVGVDSTTTASNQIHGGRNVVANTTHSPAVALYRGYPGIGYHRLVWLESSEASGTTTWVGTSGGAPSSLISGIQAEIMA